MSLNAADVRFLLPHPPESAAVSADLPAISDGLAEVGVPTGEQDPDLLVVSRRAARGLRADVTGSVVVLGGWPGGRSEALRRFAALPSPVHPHTILPADRPRVARYAVSTSAAPGSVLKRIRDVAAVTALAPAVFRRSSRALTLRTPQDGLPFVLGPAAELGIPTDADWFVGLGGPDPLSRGVFHVFEPGEASPRWAVKFSRLPGSTEPFDRDERGFGLAAAAGRVVAAHAPHHHGRYEVGGLPVSVESAAVGRKLTHLLRSGGRRSRKLDWIERVAAWIITLGKETAAPPEALSAERHRLARQVLPAVSDRRVADALERLGPVPAVLQHNDLGSWNIVAGAESFVVVDWESANGLGFPLWDLIYFLVDALLNLDGRWDTGDRELYAAQLLLGQLRSSGFLFRIMGEAVRALGLDPTDVPTIITLGWLHHGSSSALRAEALERHAPGVSPTESFGDWMARVWMGEPGLGLDWSAWRA